MYIRIMRLLFKWETLPCCFPIFPFTSSCLSCSDPLKPQVWGGKEREREKLKKGKRKREKEKLWFCGFTLVCCLALVCAVRGSRPRSVFLSAAGFIAPWRGALWSAEGGGSSPVHHASIPFSVRKIWWPGSSGWSLGKCETLLGLKAPGRGGEDIKTVARTPILAQD